jgi:hypothetical protein
MRLPPEGRIIIRTEMKRLGTGWVRIVAAIFTNAMFYASFCSTTCALGVCPNQERRSANHDCGHTSHNHSSSSHHHGPEKSDCSQHDHPTLALVKADGLLQFQSTIRDQINVNELLSSLSHTIAPSSNASSLSDLAPPPTLKDPLHLRISVLRI